MLITYSQPNGQLAIMFPAGDVNDSIKDVPEGAKYKIVESINIDDYYFDAYEFNEDTGAKINIERAKKIHIDHFRLVRDSILADLDIEFMKAIESKDEHKQKEVSEKKQSLRDITKIELPSTFQELKNTWPEILGKSPFI